MNVKVRAALAARVFDVLAWVTLGIGALAAALMALGGLLSGDGQAFLVAIAATIGIVVYTILSWAMITLASSVAGYIAARSE